MKTKSQRFPSASDIRLLTMDGPWESKSGGILEVLSGIPGIPLEVAEKMLFRYDHEELALVPADIRGLRIYTVRNIPEGTIAGTEWHRIRTEMIFALDGAVAWDCEDVFGEKRSFRLDQGAGIWMPPFILHTYTALLSGSRLMVVANTLFFPKEPRESKTRDTYPEPEFRKLQGEYAEKL